MNGKTVDLIINVVFVLLALAAVVACSIRIERLRRMKRRFRAAIILIPLNYGKVRESIAVVFLAVGAAGCVALAVVTGEYIIFSALAVVMIMLILLAVTMLSCCFGVLDGGVVTPYAYIDWLHLNGYEIKNDIVVFVKSRKRRSIFSNVNPQLRFDESNRNKLEFLLNKNKHTK